MQHHSAKTRTPGSCRQRPSGRRTSAPVAAGDDKHRTAVDSGRRRRSRVGASPVGFTAPGYRLRDLPDCNRDSDLLVAPALTPLHQFRLFETMKNALHSLLEQDHESLDQLLTELDAALAKPGNPHVFELLDLFWARLAVHIRAENLHLFPALANAPANRLTGKDGQPTPDEVEKVLTRLRSDHDFFIGELARMIKALREKKVGVMQAEAVDALRTSLRGVRKRLEDHNRLEENHVYLWPALIFDDEALARLNDQVRRELENLPPRFASLGLS